MDVEIDPTSSAVYVTLRAGKVSRTHEITDLKGPVTMNVDLDQGGEVIGFELIGLRRSECQNSMFPLVVGTAAAIMSIVKFPPCQSSGAPLENLP